MSTSNYLSLRENIISQAKYFLENANEFYPFGATINSLGELKPIGVYLEDEHMNSQEDIIILENVIKKGIENNIYDIGAIGIDVYISTNKLNGVEKKEGLEIRVYAKDKEVAISRFFYYKRGKKYYFEELRE